MKRVVWTSVAVALCGMAMAQAPADQRAQARKLKLDGNFAEAYQAYRAYVFAPGLDADQTAEDLLDGVACLQALQRIKETDGFVEEVLKAHADQLAVVVAAARATLDAPSYGFLIAGAFERGGHRGGGEPVTSGERDRVRALQILVQASPLAGAATDDMSSRFWRALAEALMRGREGGASWKLQELSDLAALPDYEPGRWGWRGGYGGGEEGGGAPVDEAGNPVYPAVPASWEKAANDGERWRWALTQLEKCGGKYAAKEALANFAIAQYGTETLARYGTAFQDTELATSGVWALHTLKDDETIAQLATGAKRFTLHPEYNYLRLAKELAVEGGHWADRVAQLYENRRQYPAAAEAWRAAITKHGKEEYRQRALDQIVQPWARIEGTRTQTPVGEASFDLVHRNANSVSFTVRRLDMEALIADLQSLLKGNPQQIDWWQTQLEQLGYRMVEGNGTKYLREEVAAWTRKLQARGGHFDTRETITTPQPLKPGAYVVTGRAADGNETRAVLWIADTVILRKSLANDDHSQWVAVLDAESGQPIAGANLEFFGWHQRYNDARKGGRRVDFLTTSHTMTTDADGFALPPMSVYRQGNVWWQTIIVARTADGRFAFSGFERVWWGRSGDSAPQVKPYGITDRPVYRPAQTVKFKVWVAKADYGGPDESPWAGRKVGVVIRNPKGEDISDKTYVADAFGGIDADLELVADAPLGVYSLQVRLSNIGLRGACSFRVEEYKKPEFEVAVKAPEKPVALGERIEATVTATYTFGAPVAQGKAKIKVTRTANEATWWPVHPWDWLYGAGYAWFGYDYDWYPGWARWGLCRPVPSWWWRPTPPPEVVLEMERPLEADGTVKVAFDTALAKALYGSTDHRYSITAEVTDASRRTITGQGQVLVAREPFRAYVWTDRTICRAGDDVVASVKAQTPDGQPVRGVAELTLYRVVSYDAEGLPKEEKIRGWKVGIGETGEAQQTFAASRKGQYRIVARVTDGEKHVQEGGQVFTVRGDGDDGRDYRFANLELVPDKAEYVPGDTVRLQVNADAADSAVMLFVRPQDGAVAGKPQWLRLKGKSVEVPIEVAAGDRPNFFVEAVTVHGGRVHTEAREIVVPPDQRVVNVAVVPDAARVLPGAEAGVTVTLTDVAGKPCDGSVVLSVYDKAVEYISGGSNVPKIRSFFWNWRRRHQPRTEHTLDRAGESYLLKGEVGMGPLGLFGASVADESGLASAGIGGGAGVRSRSMVAHKMAPTTAPMLARGMAFGAEADGAPMMMMAAAAEPLGKMAGEDKDQNGAGGAAAPAFVEAAVRSEFADTAYWSPSLKATGEKGVYRATFKMPDDLTGWKTRAWAMGPGVRVGEGASEIVTAKNLMLRLQAPRFFTQRDEVVLSANIHNYLDSAKKVRAVLELQGQDGAAAELVDGKATQDVDVAAQGEARVDWRVRVTQPGQLTVRMKALTDVESDAMERTFPVQVHGMLKTEAWSGVVRPKAGNGQDSATVKLRVPAERRPEQTRLEVRWSPTLAGAMLDALPYLIDYPYGCTEQTLNRFLPVAVTRHTLRELGMDLDAVRQRQSNLNPQEIGDDKQRMAQWKRFDRNPVFDGKELDRIVDEGLDRLKQMQLTDGGWGWFSGYGERSDAHTTCTVVHGLRLARDSGADVPADMVQAGVAWLRRHQDERVRWIGEKRKERRTDNTDALVAMVLADEGFSDKRMLDWLYEDRDGLSFYAKAVLGLAYDRLKDERRDMLARNCVQFLKEDAENQSAWFELGNGGYWWCWYGSENEAQAYGLMLLVRTQPKSDATAGLVKYLLNNRKHATYWNSTRDTALCVEAMAAFLKATGEGKGEMTVEVKLDGKVVKTVAITPERLLDFDNAFVVEGVTLADGEHVVEVARRGDGPLYFNAYLTNFTLEDPIQAAGLEVKVQRQIYRLKDVGQDATGRGTRGQSVAQRREKTVREPLKDGEWVTSGDLLEIELVVESKNDYEYLVFEDMKAAGCEPVEVRSGYTDRGLRSYVEYRDNRVAFFVRQLARGKHSVNYRVRAEIPGRFSALPTRGWAMYAPELRANSDEAKLLIRDE
jgi:hypothetical protein